MTLAITALPASIAVTNVGTEPLVIGSFIFQPSVARTLTLTGMRADPYVVNLWNALFANQQAGRITCVPAIADYVGGSVGSAPSC